TIPETTLSYVCRFACCLLLLEFDPERTMKTTTTLLLLLNISITCLAQTPPPDRQQFIRIEAPVVALTHVRVIDGTGAAPLEDQTIVISAGKIDSIAPTATARVPSSAQILDLKGHSVLPGLVGMH